MRFAAVLSATVAIIVAGCAIGILFGAARIEPERLLDALFTGGRDPVANVVLRELRLPRAVAALLAGASLGLAGALLQSATRNPLGDPYIFGLGNGAVVTQSLSLAGILTLSSWGLASISVAGSLLIGCLLYMFTLREDLSASRFALVGVSIGALMLAVATGILTYAQVFTQQSLALLTGSVANRGWSDLTAVLPYLGLGIVLVVLIGGRINVLALGDRLAAQLGANPKQTQLIAIVAASVLSGVGVSIAGVVGFVGLLAPHVARLLVGNDVRKVLALSLPIGAAVLLYADQVARLALMPSELPAGLVTTVLGAPLMIWVARKVL